MFPIIMLIITVVVILIHIALTRKPRKTKNILEIILLDYFIIAVGLGSLIAGLAHILNGPEIANGIGWAAGSPFQDEVGAANIAIGIAALISPWFRGAYWLAVAIVSAVFGIGAAGVHIRSIFMSHDTAVYNAGPMLYFGDILMPIVLLILVSWSLLGSNKKNSIT